MNLSAPIRSDILELRDGPMAVAGSGKAVLPGESLSLCYGGFGVGTTSPERRHRPGWEANDDH